LSLHCHHLLLLEYTEDETHKKTTNKNEKKGRS
jgi:hypothetical protein